jgi:hypothetical protein
MKIFLTYKNSIALIFLSFIMQETHELAHTGVGRLICGCWGERNFNVWGVCEGCAEEHPLAILSTFAGPFYSFLVLGIGFTLLFASSSKVKSIGFALIIATMPFSRIITPLLGGGDEIYGLNKFLHNHSLAWAIGLPIVLVFVLPPVVKVWKVIDNKKRVWWFIGLLFVPFIIVGAVVFGILQGLLLNKGFMSEYWILGSPKLVTTWFIISVVIFTIFSKSIQTLLQPSGNVNGREV